MKKKYLIQTRVSDAELSAVITIARRECVNVSEAQRIALREYCELRGLPFGLAGMYNDLPDLFKKLKERENV